MRWRYKNTPQVPTPADPRTVAQAQTGSNINTAVANAGLQNVNQNTPYGSTTFNQTGGYTDPSTGTWVPSYTENTSLNPLAQSILTGTEQTAANLTGGTQDLAKTAAGAMNAPLNFGGVNQDYLNKGPQLLNDTAANAVYSQQKGFLDPQWGLQEQQLHDQLSRQGIPVGSDAYNSAMTQFNNSKTQAYQSAQDAGTAAGVQGGQNLFNMALAGQQQNIGQQQTAQQNPLRLLNLAFGGGNAPAAAGVA